MDLTVIIVNWNTRELLRDCLRSLPAAVGDLASEVLVVDNASADGSAEMVRTEFPRVNLIESGANLGFSRANNLGLMQARGAAVVLLNPDTVCLPDSLRRLHGFLQSTPDAGVAGPTLLDAQRRPTITHGNFPAVRYHWFGLLDPQRRWLPQRWRRDTFVQIPTPGCRTGPVDYVAGACLMIKADLQQKIGLLDERFFMYFEETDWCKRVWEANHRVHHVPDAEVIHLEGRSAEQVSRFSLAQFQHSYRLFIAKHYGPGRIWHFRVAQFAEYGMKGLLRWLAPGNRTGNRRLARKYFAIAGLQLRSEVAPTPPG